ncbi:Cilia- and flagella-associated protein 43 [Coelomomyces lativittatus]|nr:Cilia- and flagella-associated protein 43 [Coelomomyces lativittatus]KAJ1512067.1 Cilia- and flagella-associated protein 43 [Coelomomyces lativittatus]KAJ1517017.1 Cilia- and flagella-associated protein 43 [Coelomomyces lativittatus]
MDENTGSLTTPEEEVRSLNNVNSTEVSHERILAYQLRKDLKDLKVKLNLLLDQNAAAPEAEKLTPQECLLNHYHLKSLQAAANLKIQSTRDAILNENKKKREEIEHIKKLCWEPMEIQAKTLRSLISDFSVSNYPIPFPSPSKQKKYSQVVTLRQAQGAQPPFYLFPPLQLISRERQQMQLVLYEKAIEIWKREFNVKFEAILKFKTDELAKINDKYLRMRQILKELNASTAGLKPLALSAGAVPESFLEVHDDEIKVPKYLSEEEEQKLTHQKALEKERLESNHDDSRTRALQVMMGGTLEVEENKNMIFCTVPKPECMETKPKAEWNEEEKKLVKDYEKKLATVKEEQEKYRKSLETELRKCETGVEEIKQAFEVKLDAFLDEKHQTDNLIHQAELRMLLIVRRILFSKKEQTHLELLRNELSTLKSSLKHVTESLPEFKLKVDKEKEAYEPLLRKEKELEKQLKKDFIHATVPIETILKLHRKRIKAADGNSMQVQLDESDCIPGFTPSYWQLLNEYRGKRLQIEAEVKTGFSKWETAKSNFDRATSQVDELQRQYDASIAKVNEFEKKMFQNAFNLEDLWHLKQGQVEIVQSPVVTDYSKAVMIHKNQVDDLNSVISSLGQEKLKALKEMKNYRKGILALQWEIKVLDFQIEDMQLKTRDIQLLRVTKHMQEYIRSGNEGSSANLVATLEKQLAYSESALRRKLEERQRQCTNLKHQIKEKKKSNRQLSANLKEIENITQQREVIMAKRPKVEDTSGISLFSCIANVKKMEQIAHDHSKGIELLTNEVQRWRLKTFPNFQNSANISHLCYPPTPSTTQVSDSLPPLTAVDKV